MLPLCHLHHLDICLVAPLSHLIWPDILSYACLFDFKRAQESLESFDTSLPLLEFIRVFVESHIERAVTAGTSGAQPEILPLIEGFLDTFSTLTQSCTEPEILYKLILVWEGLMAFETAKEVILSNANCLQSVRHSMVFSCSIQ